LKIGVYWANIQGEKMLNRPHYLLKLNNLLNHSPVVAILGVRQVGKTTLARLLAESFEQVTFFDLENPGSLAWLSDPMLALEPLTGLVIIDEIQHQPELFKTLRVLSDRPSLPCRFLVLGSASPTLLRQGSESLAGRIAYVDMEGFSLQEVGREQMNKLWLRGGFPRSFLASTEQESIRWRNDFIRTFLERDLPAWGIQVPALTLRRFWMMLAHYHGQLWNGSELARAFGISQKVVRHYLDIMTGAFVIKQLSPWWENISKRQVKAPKIYLNDSGLLHTLLGIDSQEALENHPKVGASWEGFALNTVLTQLNVRPEEAFFWASYGGAELDLLVIHGNTRLGFEFKRTSMPKISKSLHIAIEDLKLSEAFIVHAGQDSFPLATNITAISLKDVPDKLPVIGL
jgi:predicted AAA+ superfamily ATPase